MELVPTVPGPQAEANENWDSWAGGQNNYDPQSSSCVHNDEELNQRLQKVIVICWSRCSIQNPAYAVAQEN